LLSIVTLIRSDLRLVLPVDQKSFIHRFWPQINILVDLTRQTGGASSANTTAPIQGNLRYFSVSSTLSFPYSLQSTNLHNDVCLS